jgi:nucleoside-triphosphatase THEP1
MHNKIFIIKGTRGSGKSTFLAQLIYLLKKEGISIGGFIAHGFWKNNVRDKFELEDLQTREKITLCQTDAVNGWEKFRRFYFNPEGFVFGENSLSPDNLQNVEITVIDEIGPFELQGKGWRKAIDKLLAETDKPMIWVCRESILKEIVEDFNLQSYQVIDISKEVPKKIAAGIISQL